MNARGQVVRLAGSEGVYVVNGFERGLYTRDARDWREWKVASIDERMVTSVTVTNPSGSFVFSKTTGSWAGTANGRRIENFDGGKVLHWAPCRRR